MIEEAGGKCESKVKGKREREENSQRHVKERFEEKMKKARVKKTRKLVMDFNLFSIEPVKNEVSLH